VSLALESPLLETHLSGLTFLGRGKVRDLYEVDDRLLIVATDRISAFDFVLGSGIPDKGRVLTQLSVFWFEFLQPVTPTHFITADLADYPPALQKQSKELDGRSMLVHRTKPLPVECVARGYLSGSGWKDYRTTGAVCGIKLPSGLRESEQLPEPIFTPATKATSGHDENISFDQMARTVGGELSEELRARTLRIYQKASEYARSRGLILADTKFEFGLLGEELQLIDEVLTPDSSRFWGVDDYHPGRSQPAFDKQFVRDYLESSGWNKQPPAPALPAEVVQATRQRYLQAYKRLTGNELGTPAD
jgi:phosphoribosylaminoimidazole-succinocarboxamide synthase